MNTDDLFGPAIHTYSRARAIADGALVDLTATQHTKPPSTL
jgi:type I site-specific restriction endonuclease